MSRTPKTAVPTKRGRYYTDPADTTARYVSVTNVLDTAMNKPALVGWAAKTVAQTAVNSLVHVTRMARLDHDAAVSWLKGQPYAEKDAAAEKGSRLHELAEAHKLGQDVTGLVDVETEPDVHAMLQQFLAFLEDFAPEYEATEATVVNRTLGYAGTLDGLLRFGVDDLPGLDSPLVVGDYKTGRTGPYPEWGLQLAAYANAEALWLPDGTEIAMPAVSKTTGVVIRVRPDHYALHTYDLTGLIDVFAHMAEVTRWVHADPESIITGPVIPASASQTAGVA